jgi:NodT family efflux transporter outer membrane factor (OMF) lipoprotein
VLLPSIGAGVNAAERREVSPFGRGQESLVAMPAFQASYEIDMFGKNRARIDAAKANLAASKAAEEAARLSVTAATASGYVALLALDARLDVLTQTLQSRSEALKFARDRAEVGYTSQLELRQSQAEYEATALQIPQVETQIARQENALSILTGILPNVIERGGRLADLAQPQSPSMLPSELLRRRPDVAAAEFRIVAADAQMRSARAQFMPSVNLSASAGLAVSDLLSDPVSVWSIGGSILAPIFQGGRLQGQLDAATAQRDQAAWAYRGTALNAFREVEDRMVALYKLDQQQLSLLAQQAAVSEVLRHTRNRYRAGYISYIEQLDAQRALLSVDLALVQLRADRLTTLIGLYQAVGGPPANEAAE